MAKPPAKPKKLNIFEQRMRNIERDSGIEGVTYNKKPKKKPAKKPAPKGKIY
jgi:hypothetical protein